MDWKQGAMTAAQAAIAFMAAKKAGPYAVAAYMQGLQMNRARQQEDQRAQEQQGMQQQLQQSTLDTQALSRQNMTADNARQDDESRLRKIGMAGNALDSYATGLGETATDPIMAQDQLAVRASGLEQTFGIPQGQVANLAPPMAPMISARKKKQAKDLYESAAKRYNQSGENPEWETSITLRTGEQFGDVTPAKLREMYEAPALGQDGQPALPPKAKRQTQILDLGGKKVVVDPDALEPGQEFADVPLPKAAGAGGAASWVTRNGQPVRVREGDIQPGDTPYSSRESLRNVTSGDAGRIAELDTSLDDLDTLTKEIGTTGAASKIGAMLPNVVTEYTGWGSDAKSRQAVIDRVKQVIGKALEGGVLRREDEYKYVKILPTIGDPPEVAKTKLAGLKTAIEQRRQRLLEALGDAEFDVSKFPGTNAPPAASAPRGDSDPLGLFK